MANLTLHPDVQIQPVDGPSAEGSLKAPASVPVEWELVQPLGWRPRRWWAEGWWGRSVDSRTQTEGSGVSRLQTYTAPHTSLWMKVCV